MIYAHALIDKEILFEQFDLTGMIHTRYVYNKKCNLENERFLAMIFGRVFFNPADPRGTT